MMMLPKNALRYLFLLVILHSAGCAQLTGLKQEPSVVSDSAKVEKLLSQAIAAESDDANLAEQLYQQMMMAGAKAPRSLNRYAVYLRKQYRFGEAEATYQQALKNAPADADTHYNLAILHELYQGDFVKAKRHYELYLSKSSEPDPRVKGWIKDLDRRIAGGA